MVQADGHELRRRAGIHDALSSAIDSGGHGLAAVPGLLRQVLENGTWREFVTSRGEHVQHENFVSFLNAPPLKGLGASAEMLQRIIMDDPALSDMLDRQLQNPPGRPRKTLYNVQDSQDMPEEAASAASIPAAPTGNSRGRALRRLRQDAPELHARVLAGELSPHKAMVEAGLRPRTVTITPAEPASVARTLRREMSPDHRATLIELLQHGDTDD